MTPLALHFCPIMEASQVCGGGAGRLGQEGGKLELCKSHLE